MTTQSFSLFLSKRDATAAAAMASALRLPVAEFLAQVVSAWLDRPKNYRRFAKQILAEIEADEAAHKRVKTVTKSLKKERRVRSDQAAKAKDAAKVKAAAKATKAAKAAAKAKAKAATAPKAARAKTGKRAGAAPAKAAASKTDSSEGTALTASAPST